MNNFSNYAENAILNHSLRGINYIKPSSYWYALFSEHPGENGDPGSELFSGEYDRVEVINDRKNFPQCSPNGAPSKTNGKEIFFPLASGSQGKAKYWGLYNAPRQTIQFYGTTTSSSSVITGIASTANLRVGMSISSGLIPSNSIILEVLNSTDIRICTATKLALGSELGVRSQDWSLGAGTVTYTIHPKLIIYAPLLKPITIHSSKIAKIPDESLKITIPQSSKGGLTRYSESKILDLFFGHLPYPAPIDVYTGLGSQLTIAGDNNDQINEIDEEPDYSRQLTVFGPPQNGICRNVAQLTYDTSATAGIIINSMGIWDDDDGGRLIWAGFTAKTVKTSATGTDFLMMKIGGMAVQIQ